MNDHNQPENQPKANLSPFLMGVLVGASITLAFTTKKGKDNLSKMTDLVKDLMEELQKRYPELANIDNPFDQEKPLSHNNFPNPPEDEVSHF